MRVDIDALKKKITDRGMTQENLAKSIGIDNSTFYRKINSDALTFSIGQMHKIADVLSLSPEDATKIFLCEISQ